MSFYDNNPDITNFLINLDLQATGLFRAAKYEEVNGYPKKVAILHWDKRKIISNDGFVLTAGQKSKFEGLLSSVEEWPKETTLDSCRGDWLSILPEEIREKAEAQPHDYRFPYLNEKGELFCYVIREDMKDGKKRFLPYTPYTYKAETLWLNNWPERAQLFGLETLRDASTVLVVEGERKVIFLRLAKALHAAKKEGRAHEIDEIRQRVPKLFDRLTAFPWADAIPDAILSAPNGVMNVRDADWSPLNKGSISRVIYWPDADAPGRAAVPEVSEAIKKQFDTLEVDSTIYGQAAKWDCVDAFAKSNYNAAGDYIGKDISSFIQDCTWMTDMWVDEKEKQHPILRDHVKGKFAYLTDDELFVDVRSGELYDQNALNKRLTRWSHSNGIAPLIMQDSSLGNLSTWCFRPREHVSIFDTVNSNLINIGGRQTINTFRPRRHKAIKGDLTEFKEYMEYLVPDGVERKEVIQWAGTVIEKTTYRILYALLLSSVMTGVGKSTFYRDIMKPLVGEHYTQTPRNEDVNRFLNWAFGSRLAIIDEFEIDDSKDFDRLKNLITETVQTYEAKGVDAVQKETQTALGGSYNPKNGRPFRIDQTDRRFLVVNCAETAWTAKPEERWAKFHAWLQAGGLHAIAYLFQHLEEYDENFEWHGQGTRFKYVAQGAKAPLTTSKKKLLEENMSEAKRLILDVFEDLKDDKEAIKVPDFALKNFVSRFGNIQKEYTPRTLMSYMQDAGWTVLDERESIRSDDGPRKCKVAVNRKTDETYRTPRNSNEIEALFGADSGS